MEVLPRGSLVRVSPILGALVLLLAACGGESSVVVQPERPMLAIGTDPVTGASIITDKDDYSPGDTVHITGARWTAGETVHIVLTEEPQTHDAVAWDVAADSAGGFTDVMYLVEDHDLGVTFTLTATGQTSGSSATAVFTDAVNLKILGADNLQHQTAPAEEDLGSIAQGTDLTLTCPRGTGLTLSAGGLGGSTTLNWSLAYAGTGTDNATLSPLTTVTSSSGSLTGSGDADCVAVTITTGTLSVGTTYHGSLRVTGAGAGDGPYFFKFTVSAPSNTAPVLDAIGNQSILEGTALSFTATATDDGLPSPPAALSFSLETPGAACLLLHPQVPAGATITGAGAFSWTPTEAEGPQVYCARIQVSDGSLADFEDIEITVTEGNAAPVLGAIGNQVVDELATLSFNAGATDSDIPAQALSFSLGTPSIGCGFPIAAGASITTAGAFSWTPTEAQGPGTYCARIEVSDAVDSDFEEIQIAVAEVNVPPVLDPIGPQSIDEEALLGFTATATDVDLPANTLTFSLGTPVGCGHPIAAGAAITSGGAFSWTPTEAQGPGTFCARVEVFDGTDTDFEDIVITVAEVNKAPVLTVPANFSIQWGVAISGVQASATDADIPTNGLTFSLEGTVPAGMTIHGTTGVISWTPTGAQVGPHIITVRVTDDGSPVLYDEDPTFTITVIAHATTLVYNGSTSGQYSDKAKLSATLTDDVTSTAITGADVSFTFDGADAGTDATDGSGKAEVLYAVPKPDGNYNVAASYAGSVLYDAAGPTSTDFDVDKEDAEGFTITNLGSVITGATSFQVVIGIKEALFGNGNEPDQNDGQLPGDIAYATPVTANGNGVGTNTNISAGTCADNGTAGGTGYAQYHKFTCTFTNGGPAIPVDVYTLSFNVGGTYYTGSYEDIFSIWDPNAGFATGGGWFMLGGDKTSFGFSFTMTKGKTTPRGGLVVVRHLPGGGVCRVKSNSMNAPSVTGNVATLGGKGNYNCVIGGVTTISQGNLNIIAVAEDWGTSGANEDKFRVKAIDQLDMTVLALLGGGNVQVPQPQKK